MIQFHLNRLIALKSMNEGRRITIREIAEETGINRVTLSKMINTENTNCVIHNVDALCEYFGCDIQDIATFIPAKSAKLVAA